MFEIISTILLGTAIFGNAYFMYRNIKNALDPKNPIKCISIAAAAIGSISLIFAALVLGVILL